MKTFDLDFLDWGIEGILNVLRVLIIQK